MTKFDFYQLTKTKQNSMKSTIFYRSCKIWNFCNISRMNVSRNVRSMMAISYFHFSLAANWYFERLIQICQRVDKCIHISFFSTFCHVSLMIHFFITNKNKISDTQNLKKFNLTLFKLFNWKNTKSIEIRLKHTFTIVWKNTGKKCGKTRNSQ